MTAEPVLEQQRVAKCAATALSRSWQTAVSLVVDAMAANAFEKSGLVKEWTAAAFLAGHSPTGAHCPSFLAGLVKTGNRATFFQRDLVVMLAHGNTLVWCCTSFVSLGRPFLWL